MIAIKRISPNLANKLRQRGAPKPFFLLEEEEQQQQQYSNPTSYYIINFCSH
jgi:hypothetical protein